MRTKLAAMFLAAVASCWAQPPRIRDAQVETRPAAGGLEQAVSAIVSAQTAPAWVGWSAPLVAGERSVCWNEGASASKRAINLELPRTLNVFVRVQDRRIAKVRPATPDCEIDGNGATVYWLSDVPADQSVALLESLTQSEEVAGGAIAAIALHAHPSADSALDRLAASSRTEAVRRKAVFWMGAARGRRGYESLLRILRRDSNEKIREHAVFALSQNQQPGAIDAIIATARQDTSVRVRGQALFWLAQAAQRKVAAEAIARAIESDPEMEVKKKAVFALSRLPNDEGVPKLIEVARTNHNPEVRKQAMFWLGQSKDPRALQFFEQILSK